MSDDREAFRLNPKIWPDMKARCSHPHLFKAQAMKINGAESGKKSFSIELLFDKTTTKLARLLGPLQAAARAKWGEDKEAWPQPLRYAVSDGDVPKMNKKKKIKEVKPEHKGMWVVKASSSEEYPPKVVDRDPKVSVVDAKRIYPGCYVRVAVMAFAYEFSEQSTGVKYILDVVQFHSDGPALGNSVNVSEVFGVVEGDDLPAEDEATQESLDGAETSEAETFL